VLSLYNNEPILDSHRYTKKYKAKSNLICLDFAQCVLNNGPSPRQGKKSDQAHPPIHPTKYTHGLQGLIYIIIHRC